MVEVHSEISRHSRLFTRGPIDGRSRSGRYLARCREELRRHLGADASAVQLAMVDRVAMLQLRLMLLDERAASGAVLTAAEERAYTSLTSGVVRAMRTLGLRPAKPATPSIAEYFAERAAEREAAARGAVA